MSKLNKLQSSVGKSKSLRNLAIAGALFGVMNTTQSCKDKNAGIPVHADAIEFSQEENTNTSKEQIKIDDKTVVFKYTFDIAEGKDWNQKYIEYTISLSSEDANNIVLTIDGSTLYGNDASISEYTKNFNTTFEYISGKEYKNKCSNDVSNYINTIMNELQENNKDLESSPDEEYENTQINQNAQNEVLEKTEKLVGYLNYKMNPSPLTVQKKGDTVLLPIEWNGNRFDFVIKENKTGIKLQNNKKEEAKTYDITCRGKTKTIGLSNEPMKFAEELTKEIEKLMKVGDIPQKIEDEAFLGKCLEVQQLIEK